MKDRYKYLVNYIPTRGRRPRLRLSFPFSDMLSIEVRDPQRHVKVLNNQHLAPRSSRMHPMSRGSMSMSITSARFPNGEG
jgi:hypothetical protein